MKEAYRRNFGAHSRQMHLEIVLGALKVFEVSLKVTVPDEPEVAPLIAPCSKKETGDYQCNNAMSCKGTEFRGPQPVGQAIMRNLPASDMIESCSVAGPGFINVKLSTKWIAKSIQKILTDGIDTWAPKLSVVKRAIVDFSSPNIAKEMHVGHLRSTIIGTLDLLRVGLIEESEGAEVKDTSYSCQERWRFQLCFYGSCSSVAAKRAGWLPTDENKYPKTSHVGFDLVLGDDGKRFRTRSTEVWLICLMKLKLVVKQHLWNEVRLLRSLSKLLKQLDMVLLSSGLIVMLNLKREPNRR